jgi:hypothetical protein
MELEDAEHCLDSLLQVVAARRGVPLTAPASK